MQSQCLCMWLHLWLHLASTLKFGSRTRSRSWSMSVWLHLALPDGQCLCMWLHLASPDVSVERGVAYRINSLIYTVLDDKNSINQAVQVNIKDFKIGSFEHFFLVIKK